MSRALTRIYVDNIPFDGFEAAANALGCDRSCVRAKLVIVGNYGSANFKGHVISLETIKTEPKEEVKPYAPKTHRRGEALLSRLPEVWYGLGRGEA